MTSTASVSTSNKFASAPPSAAGWTAEYAVPLGGPGHLLLATFEQAAIGIAHLTLAEEWISVNQRYCEITGYSRAEILKLKLEELTHPDDVTASQEFLGRIRSGELARVQDGEALHPEGWDRHLGPSHGVHRPVGERRPTVPGGVHRRHHRAAKRAERGQPVVLASCGRPSSPPRTGFWWSISTARF